MSNDDTKVAFYAGFVCMLNATLEVAQVENEVESVALVEALWLEGQEFARSLKPGNYVERPHV
jgi:hypothetical protein